MSVQASRLLVFTVRLARPRPGSRLCMKAPGSLAGGPRTLLAQRRAYSLDSKSPGPGTPLGHRNLSATALSVQGQCRPLSLDLGEVEENTRRAQAFPGKKCRHFIIEPAIADVVTRHLGPDLEDCKAAIFECNPGPGVLTKSLLNAGAHRVIALESNKVFLPDLQDLESRLDGQLEVVHCDFLKMDIPVLHPRPPCWSSDRLFNDLGITEVNWMDDVPVKVVGVMGQKNEKSKMLKMLYALFERSSFYHYGRVQLNMFISEKTYTSMVVGPGNNQIYRSSGVLFQIGFDIELLHKEPWSSFFPSTKPSIPKSVLIPNDHLCLVRVTPKKDLWSSYLSPSNSQRLITMVQQCMVKRTAPLKDRLNSWSPESGPRMLQQLGLPEDIKAGQVTPEQYLQLFSLMEQSQEYSQNWVYQELMDENNMVGYDLEEDGYQRRRIR